MASCLQLGGSWEHLGSNFGVLGGLGQHVGRFWGPCLGSFWHRVASSSIYQKPSKFIHFSMVFEGLGGLSWWSWGAFWFQVGGLGATWGYLGLKLEVLGPSWLQVGRSWGHLGSNLGDLGTILAPTWGVLEPSWGSWRETYDFHRFWEGSKV